MKRSGGRVECKYFFGQKLCKAKEQNQALMKGMADVGALISVWMPAKAPILTIGGMPGMPTEDFYTALYAARELGRTKAAQEEFRRNNLVYLSSHGHSGDLIYSNKQIKRLDDLKGMRIATWGYYSKGFKLWGAEPISMISPEIYDGIKRGVADGCNKAIFQAITLGMHEVAPYVMLPKIGINVVVAFAMNMDSWNKLPPDIKKIVTEISDEFIKQAALIYEKDDKIFYDKCKEKGMTFTRLPDEDVAKMRALVAPLWDEWASDMNKKGLPGKELKDLYYGWLKKGPPK
jgi:TRAP-type C4-dicarboxylate transport system substrate-binding protein